MDSTHHIIKLASGTYTTSAALTVPNTAVTVYGYGATVTTTTGITLQLSGAATLRLAGINFINADVNAGFLGGIGSGLTTCSVRLNDVRVDSANTWGLSGCMLVADRSTMVWPTNFDQPGIALNGPADLTMSHGIVRNAGLRIYNNARVHISNSLFRDTRYSALGIANANGGPNDISFTTFVNSPLDQTLPAPEAVTVANCILMGAPPWL